MADSVAAKAPRHPKVDRIGKYSSSRCEESLAVFHTQTVIVDSGDDQGPSQENISV